MNELKDYLQYKINHNTNKLFYDKGELDFEIKVIDCINAIEDLENENNLLKKEIKYLKNVIDFKIVRINQLQQENKELHNKIDKAIELLENCGDFESMKFQYDVNKILKEVSPNN